MQLKMRVKAMWTFDSTQRKRQSATPSRLEEALVVAPLGRRTHDNPRVESTNRVLCFSIVDKVLGELHRRFDESREIILAVAACCPKCNHFLDAATVKPLADECSIEMANLEPQLAVAKNLVNQHVQTTEDLYILLSSMQAAFPDLFSLVRAALTIPVSSASAERSFSALKHRKTYLRSTMNEDRLTHLSIERDISKNIDYDKVVDKFASVSRRIALV